MTLGTFDWAGRVKPHRRSTYRDSLTGSRGLVIISLGTDGTRRWPLQLALLTLMINPRMFIFAVRSGHLMGVNIQISSQINAHTTL
ncbi:hypothetical protein RRF57_001687 [Xylaria bambusicola]|uniref:Uncharacterized protein n=1 Tax=Xylaria bambusicola TaxID=326684 RepID=A0AAN7Z6D3_9PEZI